MSFLVYVNPEKTKCLKKKKSRMKKSRKIKIPEDCKYITTICDGTSTILQFAPRL